MGQLVVVTGCSSGIGFATAKLFALKGYKVIAGARRLGPMKELEMYGVHIVELDVTSIESVKKLAKLIETEYNGELKYLFNNAGQPCTFPALDVTDEAAKQCYEVNVLGQIRMTRELTPYIIKTKGTIGFTGLVSGILPFPFSSIYSSTKAAIHSYANTLAFELEPFEVKVINVITGGVKTNIADTRPLPKGSLYETEGIDELLQKRREMAVRNKPLEPEEYGKRVIKDFETSSIGKVDVYRGSKASILYWVLHFPRMIILYIFRKQFGLNKLFTVLRQKYSRNS